MIVLNNLSNSEISAINEITHDKYLLEEKYALSVFFSFDEESGIVIDRQDSEVKIKYSSRASLLRAYILMLENIDINVFFISEKPTFENLTLLVDNSRNAVMNVNSIKKLIRIIATMGYTSLMLYTEDTYRLDDYPYFGYMRGGFSRAELKEIDDYAYLLGIELIPCIQTLAHLENIFRWKCFSDIFDAGDALLCDEEKTYCLIESMLSTLSSTIRSRRINIGMDEAFAVGTGKHIDKFGYEKRTDIVLRHLNRVYRLCKKYNYSPIIWSDIVSKRNLTNSGQIDKMILERLPKDLELIFWSYESIEKSFYEESFKRHSIITDNPVSFAGSSCSWFGWAPLNQFAFNVLNVALPATKKSKIKDLVITVWGDDGADASPFASLTTLQHYAEFFWTGEVNQENVARRFTSCVGGKYYNFINMESLCDLPGRNDFGRTSYNPYRYMFYQDLMLGLFDRHVPKGSNEHFKKCAEKMLTYSYDENEWSYLFKTLGALCEVLSIKSELGIRIYEAYHSSDFSELKTICERDIPLLVCHLDNFLENYRIQWYRDNKMYGFEVQNIRISGVKARALETKRVIEEFLSGAISEIELLNDVRLSYCGDCIENGENMVCHAVNWNKNITPSII